MPDVGSNSGKAIKVTKKYYWKPWGWLKSKFGFDVTIAILLKPEEVGEAMSFSETIRTASMALYSSQSLEEKEYWRQVHQSISMQNARFLESLLIKYELDRYYRDGHYRWAPAINFFTNKLVVFLWEKELSSNAPSFQYKIGMKD